MPDTSLPHVVPLKGGSNFRDLGGYRTAEGRIVRRGTVFRSAHLGSLTTEDRAALGQLGVRTIVDLRGVNEAAETPHCIDGVDCRVVGAHIEPGVGEKIRGAVADGSATPHLMMQFLTDHYRDYPRRCAPGFRTLFATLNDGTHRPLVFHCTAGKDRTGVLLGLVMDVVGVSADDIATEYGLSDASVDRLIDYLRSTGRKLEGTDAEIRARLSTPPDRMAGFMDLVRERFGSAEAYFRTRGIEDDAFARVRTLLTAL